MLVAVRVLKDPQKKRQCINYLSTRDILKSPKLSFVLEKIRSQPPKEDNLSTSNMGQNGSINSLLKDFTI